LAQDLYLVPFLSYSTLNNGVPLKSGLVSYKVIEKAPFYRSHTSWY